MASNTLKTLPFDPTHSMWSGLARDIVMWTRLYNNSDQTGANLFKHLRSLGHVIPEWLHEEVADSDTVPPKGTVAVIIYKAMFMALDVEVSMRICDQHTATALQLARPLIEKMVGAGLGGMDAAICLDAIKLAQQLNLTPLEEYNDR